MPDLSRELETTLHRAVKLATDRHHEYSTIEHLLLAMLDDADVVSILNALKVNVRALKATVQKYVDVDLETLVLDDEEEAKPTTGFQRIVQRAVLHVQNAGQQTVTGANLLVALFTERESHAVYFLQEQNLNRLDVVAYISHGIGKTVPKTKLSQLDEAIKQSAGGAPEFRVSKGKIKYQQSSAGRRLKEYKEAAQERCVELQSICGSRGNEQPQLKRLADKYALALQALSRTKGAYQLLLLGEEIRAVLQFSASSSTDKERSIRIDPDLEAVVRSLLTAHAGLMTLFPDAMSTAAEIDRFQLQSDAVAKLFGRSLGAVLQRLDGAKDIFDEDTQAITSEFAKQGVSSRVIGDVLPTRTTEAAQLGWVRGALASIGHYAVKLSSGIDKAIRDAVIKESVSSIIADKDALGSAIIRFLQGGKDALLALAHSAPASFGWLESLLKWVGLS